MIGHGWHAVVDFAKYATDRNRPKVQPLADIDKIADLFIRNNMIIEVTDLLIEALSENKP